MKYFAADMKNYILLLFVLFAGFSNAATIDSISVNSKLKQVTLGSLVIAKDSTMNSVVKLLGSPSRIEKTAMGIERTFVYDELGISFDLDREGKKIEAVIINYNWDEDKKAAKSMYKGKLSLDGYTITELTKSTDINANTDVKNMTCFGESMCMTPPGKNTLVILIGYKDAKMTQIGFGIGN